ncbi:hypothetical protein AALB39_15525 [Lachnospiraceae bacterium 54-53]
MSPKEKAGLWTIQILEQQNTSNGKAMIAELTVACGNFCCRSYFCATFDNMNDSLL